MLTQIWSDCTDIIFCHFRSFFALLPDYWPRKLKFGKNVKKHQEILSFYTRIPLIKITCTLYMMYGSWDIKFNRQNYFVIMDYALSPSNSPKNENIKNKKSPGDIITFHKCTKNHDRPLYCSRDVAQDICYCYFFWIILFPFTPLTAQKMEMSMQWQKSLEISSFYTRVPKIMIRSYAVPEILRVSDVIVIVHFGQSLTRLPL